MSLTFNSIDIFNLLKNYFPNCTFIFHCYFVRMPFSTCTHCLIATMLLCALGVIGLESLETGTEYKLNY